MKAGVFFIFIHLFIQIYAETDFFASAIQLEDLFRQEEKLLLHLESLIDQLQENISAIKVKVKAVKEGRQNVTDASQFMQNPLNSLVYMRSIIDYIPFLINSLQPMYGIHKLFEDFNSAGGWPSNQDVEGAANAILRLQMTYNLDVDQLVQGKIHDHSTSQLSILDCMFIAEAAFKKKNYIAAKVWMEKTFDLCFNYENSCDDNLKIDIAEHFAYTEFMSDNFTHALELTDVVLMIEPSHERAHVNKQYLIDEINKTPSYQRTGEFMLDPFGKMDQDKYYFFCCRGMASPRVEIWSKLKCYYLHYNNPYLMIGPIKVEEANLEPKIIIIKDIIYDSEIKEIQNISKPLLERSATKGGIDDEIRVSKIVWWNSDDNELVNKLLLRFSSYADLAVESSESLQVVNYGLGGHYLPHLDAFDETSAKNQWDSFGNRLATLLVYMNDVDKGGDTVFTELGLSVKPEKGTAVLWYNLYNDGEIDVDTLHAACPILIGTKWAVNLWFHESWNEFTKPCRPRNPDTHLRFV